MGKWIEFQLCLGFEKAKTQRWTVFPIGTDPWGDSLGEVRWYGPWRKYGFFPKDAVFEAQCLRDIADFCEARSKEFWEEKRKAKTAG